MHSKYDKIQEMLDSFKEELPEPDSEWPDEVRTAVKFIHNYLFEQRLTVQWMKMQCRIKGKNFSGTFKFYVGKSIQGYWLGYRIEMAKELFKEEENKGAKILLAEYALLLGFRSPSAFSMTFKKYAGCTPSEYQAKQIF